MSTRTTTNYKQFSTLVDNRQTARTHINKLKDAIKRNPEILEVQPLLVNEKLEIIDGQHRFIAASELGMPIHYNVVNGLDINTARDMNVLQRKWNVDDYAFSYAKAGNVHYKAFNEYRREYPNISTSVLITIMAGVDGGASVIDFRNGKFIMKRENDEIEWTLDKLIEIRESIAGAVPLSRTFVSALIQSINKEDFDIDEFIRQLRIKPDLFKRTSVIRDALRMIEDIYNYRKSVNMIRLY